MPAIVVEDLGATKGMGRSWRLAAGNTGKILGLSLCIWIIGLVVGSVFGAAGLLAASQLPGLAQMFFTQFVDLLANILVMPIGVTATILMYYDLRIRKEGFDLEMLAERLAAEGGGGDVMAMPQ